MFELLFRYPRTAFSRGDLVFLSPWPRWVLVVCIAAAAAALAWLMWERRDRLAAGLRGGRHWAIWALQSALVAVLLVLLWQPALSLPTLKPQQNVIAVVVDDSRSMAIADEGEPRAKRAKDALNAGVLESLRRRFQTRLYRLGETLERVDSTERFTAGVGATRIGDALLRLTEETAGLPVGAVVLLSDGADNAGGPDAAALAALRAKRIPVHTVGFGREYPPSDIEIADVVTPARALPDSRLAAQVTLVQYGHAGKKVTLKVSEAGKPLASKDVTLAAGGTLQSETILFSAGTAGAKPVEVAVAPVGDEPNRNNNAVTRLIHVENTTRRVLYLEGEPRWEFKFIRRALQADQSVHLATMLRTTQNKIYRQGVAGAKDLELGFPASVDELFGYHALVIGSVELNYFTPAQQELIRQFVDRRGGGLILLGSRSGLSDGGWGTSRMAELLPVVLPERKGAFQRELVSVDLAPAGGDSVITRLADEPAANQTLWKKLPPLADYQHLGTPKPGATVLADLAPPGRGKAPFLVIHNYGRGRVAVVGGSTWRWQMLQPQADQSHEMFWQQLLRWAVSDTPGRVHLSTQKQLLADEGKLTLNAEVRDQTYLPAADARLEAKIIGPADSGGTVELLPDAATPGLYSAEWNARQPGQYVVEVSARRGEQEIGRDVLTLERQDGVAESFRTGQNRELLERLARQTGGRYWTPSELKRLPDEVSYSDAGVTVREARELWNLPAVFLLLVGLRAAEWLLRRRWGVV